jgi:hypothetical protein
MNISLLSVQNVSGSFSAGSESKAAWKRFSRWNSDPFLKDAKLDRATRHFIDRKDA